MTTVEAAALLAFHVEGRPIPQGSKTLQTNNAGRAWMRDASSKDLRPWRKDIADAAKHAARRVGWFPPQHVHAQVQFRFARPAAHYRTGQYAHLLKPTAPPYPNVKPDGDKLVRAVFDALTTAGVVLDDATIVSHYAAKIYATAGQAAGVTIVLTDATRQGTLL